MWNRCPLCWDGLGLGTHFLRTKQGNGKPVTLPWRNLADSLLALGSGGTLSRMSCWHEAPLNSPLSPQLSLIRQIQTEEHSTAYIADTLQKSLETITGWRDKGNTMTKCNVGPWNRKRTLLQTNKPKKPNKPANKKAGKSVWSLQFSKQKSLRTG